MIDKEAEAKQAAFKARTKKFAIRIVRTVDALPHRPAAWAVSKQILRSATSVAANYRAVCRSRSRAEFVARMGVVMEEADETLFWLELIGETGLLKGKLLAPLVDEANQLVSICSIPMPPHGPMREPPNPIAIRLSVLFSKSPDLTFFRSSDCPSLLYS